MRRAALLALLLAACGGADDDARPAPDAAPDAAPVADAAPSDAAPSDGAPSDADAAPADEPWLEVGTGYRVFAPIAPNARVPLSMGPQGGYHVWAGVRGAGFAPEAVRLTFELRCLDDDRVVATADYADTPFERREDGTLEYWGAVVAFDPMYADPSAFDGMRKRLTARINDGAGVKLAASADLETFCCGEPAGE